MNSEYGFNFSSPFKIVYTLIKSPLLLLISNVVRFNIFNLPSYYSMLISYSKGSMTVP